MRPNQIDSALGRLLVIVENYPQLRSNQNIQDLQTQLEGTENRIAQARRDYNGVVTTYNVSIRRFPAASSPASSASIASLCSRPPAASRDVPKVDFEPSTPTTVG